MLKNLYRNESFKTINNIITHHLTCIVMQKKRKYNKLQLKKENRT